MNFREKEKLHANAFKDPLRLKSSNNQINFLNSRVSEKSAIDVASKSKHLDNLKMQAYLYTKHQTGSFPYRLYNTEHNNSTGNIERDNWNYKNNSTSWVGHNKSPKYKSTIIPSTYFTLNNPNNYPKLNSRDILITRSYLVESKDPYYLDRRSADYSLDYKGKLPSNPATYAKVRIFGSSQHSKSIDPFVVKKQSIPTIVSNNTNGYHFSESRIPTIEQEQQEWKEATKLSNQNDFLKRLFLKLKTTNGTLSNMDYYYIKSELVEDLKSKLSSQNSLNNSKQDKEIIRELESSNQDHRESHDLNNSSSQIQPKSDLFKVQNVLDKEVDNNHRMLRSRNYQKTEIYQSDQNLNDSYEFSVNGSNHSKNKNNTGAKYVRSFAHQNPLSSSDKIIRNGQDANFERKKKYLEILQKEYSHGVKYEKKLNQILSELKNANNNNYEDSS